MDPYTNLFLLLAWTVTVLIALLIGGGIHAAYVALLDRRARRRVERIRRGDVPSLLKRQAG